MNLYPSVYTNRPVFDGYAYLVISDLCRGLMQTVREWREEGLDFLDTAGFNKHLQDRVLEAAAPHLEEGLGWLRRVTTHACYLNGGVSIVITGEQNALREQLTFCLHYGTTPGRNANDRAEWNRELCNGTSPLLYTEIEEENRGDDIR